MRMIKKIKLIIEVDEKYYEACKDAVKELYPSQIDEVIANGIPYNSTDDLISRSALKEQTKNEYCKNHCPLPDSEYYCPLNCSASYFIKLIDNAPAVSDRYDEGYAQGYVDGSTGADWRGDTE